MREKMLFFWYPTFIRYFWDKRDFIKFVILEFAHSTFFFMNSLFVGNFEIFYFSMTKTDNKGCNRINNFFEG